MYIYSYEGVHMCICITKVISSHHQSLGIQNIEKDTENVYSGKEQLKPQWLSAIISKYEIYLETIDNDMTIKCSQSDGNIVHDSDNIDKKDHDSNDHDNIDKKNHNEINDIRTVNITSKLHKLKIMTIGKLSAFLSSCVVGLIPCKPEEIEAFNIVSTYYICICLHSVYISVYIHIHMYNSSIYILIRICMFIYML
jgi:hypothetical protein